MDVRKTKNELTPRRGRGERRTQWNRRHREESWEAPDQVGGLFVLGREKSTGNEAGMKEPFQITA